MDALTFALGRAELEAGRREPAVELLAAADRGAAGAANVDLGPLPKAYLSLAGAIDPRAVELPERAIPLHRAEAYAVLHRAGAGERQRARALKLLGVMAGDLQPDEREAIWRDAPVTRLACAPGR